MRGIVLASLLFTALLTSGTAWLFAAPADTEDLTIPVDPGVTSHPEPPGGDMRIWEANWKGLATIHQVAVEAPPGSGSLKPIVYRVDSAHDRTYRLNQSRIATRYTNPCVRRRYVMSADHTWFGRSIRSPRSRYG